MNEEINLSANTQMNIYVYSRYFLQKGSGLFNYDWLLGFTVNVKHSASISINHHGLSCVRLFFFLIEVLVCCSYMVFIRMRLLQN